MSETRAYIRLVLGTLTIIGALTAINVLIILSHLGTDIFKPLQRNIASVSSNVSFQPEKIASPIIEVNCSKKHETLRVRTRATNARILFKNCKKVGRFINTLNNNEGDVFPLKKRVWTSDFISLNEGLNSIEIPLGKKSQIVEITREIPKAINPNKAL